MNRTLLFTVLLATAGVAQAHDEQRIRDIDKVNGSITAEAGQFYGDLSTVNGGIDLLRAIRSVPELNQIKIIMATSERSVDKMDEATSNGADHYVVKPYELRDLEVRVKKVLAC